MRLRLKNRSIEFPRRSLIMGIINVNDDSFCDDGSLDADELMKQTIGLIQDGADIIDVGAESARTNREAISVEEEVRRFELFMERWKEMIKRSQPLDAQQVWPPVLSLNTWRTEVIRQILPLGGEILNDMSGLPNAENARIAAENETALLIMHSVGEPKVPHTHQQWDDITASLEQFFSEKIALAKSVGHSEETLILDPGIDFAKQRDDNLKIYRDISRIVDFGLPVLLPVSRKTVIGEVLEQTSPTERDAGSMACVVQGASEGCAMFRVHNVAATYDVLKLVTEVSA